MDPVKDPITNVVMMSCTGEITRNHSTQIQYPDPDGNTGQSYDCPQYSRMDYPGKEIEKT